MQKYLWKRYIIKLYKALIFEGKDSWIDMKLIIYLICSKKWLKINLEKLSLGLILGGTISNAIDRLIFGGVRDFIYLKFINFAIFNVADMAITVGAVLFCVAIIFLRDKKKNDRT